MEKAIRKEDVVEFIRNNAKGKIFSLLYKRSAPKCEGCGRSNKKWENEEICPHCGGKIKKYRFATGKLGVTDPKHALKPGTGKYKGESFEEALENGRMIYFDMNVDNGNGTKGNYRQCKLENIEEICLNGDTYFVN